MKKALLFILAALLLQFCSKDTSTYLTVEQPKCNNLEDPAGTGPNQVLSWIASSANRDASQTAYQIILDPSAGKLKSENDCAWNSGKIPSPESAWIPFTAPGLQPGTKYFWKVRIWDKDDKLSAWSKPAFFITCLFCENDWS